MKLIELLTRACEDAPAPLYNHTFRRAVSVVCNKWPRDRHFTDDQLAELRAALKGTQ